MMVLESLVTGWSTTKCQISFLQSWARRNHLNLQVHWFKSDPAQPFAIDEDKSHIKFMVIDEELVVLGSSNLDRASACTSGEVNIAISNADLAKQIVSTIQHHQLTGRLNV
jgi:phosphatidylserine/phosphatidylglycerophosphate/cardiolipin synthase-like enzyme